MAQQPQSAAQDGMGREGQLVALSEIEDRNREIDSASERFGRRGQALGKALGPAPRGGAVEDDQRGDGRALGELAREEALQTAFS